MSKKEVVETREFTSGVTWRVDVYADGTTSRPVPGKMWTSEPKTIQQRKEKRPKPKQTKTAAIETTREETIEL